MKIAYNPLTEAALTAAPSNNDITFDLKGIAIYAKGVKFKGTDTTYSVFKKHTSDNEGGYNGLVPVPSYTTTTTRYLREDGTWVVPTNYYRPISVNGTSILENNNTALNLVAGANISITAENSSGYTGKVTITNTGVHSTTINGNYLRVNTNGTNTDLTIPYATSAGSIAWANVSGKPSFATVATSGSYNDLSNKPSIPTVTDYYWADIKVSASSSTSTTPTFTKWTTSDLNLVSYTTGGKDLGMRVTGSVNSIGFIIGSGNTNRGIFDYTNSKWIIYKDASNNTLLPSWASKGGSTTPIYFNALGEPVACTSYSGLLTDLSSSSSTNISITVGGTTKSVTNAYAKFGVGTYTSNGGEQRPSYIGSGLVRWNMMRATTTYFSSAAYNGYCDWMMMDTYTGSDVPYVTMIGVLKAATPHAYIASGSKGDSSGKWTINTLLDSSNSSVSGGGSSGGSSITVNIGGTSKTLTIPTSLPANGGNASTANGAYYVFDYNATTTPIYIGFANAALTSSTAESLAAYGTTSSGARCIKDISATEAKKFIGLGNVKNTAFYQRNTTVNGTTWNMAGTIDGAAFTIYAPTTAGTSGQVLTSTEGTPGWTNQSSLSAGYLKIHDIRGNNYAPNSTNWPMNNIKAWFNNTGTPNGEWWSGITVKGWDNTYNVWLLASTSTSHSYASYGLFFRTGNGSNWTNWKNVVTSESVNNIVVTSSLPATKVNNTIYILI